MMSDNANPESLPVLDENDIAAVLGLLIRVMRLDDENKRDKELVAELQAALTERAPVRARFVSAIGAFGFDMTTPGTWDRVKAAIGPDKYSAAREIAAGPSTNAKHGIELGQTAISTPSFDGADQPAPKIGDKILAFLRSRQERGAEVADIKTHLLNSYAITTHEKTPGMTLYRLSKAGLVRRDGRTWFAVDANEEGEANAEVLTRQPRKNADDQ
jgi:hypothetical protein